MRQLIWLSLIPLSAFWLFSLSIYGTEPSLTYSILSILLGIIISLLAFRGDEVIGDKRYTVTAPVLILPLAISSFIIPYPYNAGLIAAALALLIFLLGPRFRALGLGVLFCGIILTAQAAVMPLYYITAPSYHSIGWLSPIVSLLSNFAGLKAASSDGMVLVLGQGNIFPFTVTLEKLGIYPWIIIFVGAAALILLISQSVSAAVRSILGILFISAIYLVIRYLLLINIFFATDIPEYAMGKMKIYADPIWLIASFIPLVLLFFATYKVTNFRADLRPDIDRRHIIAYALVFLGVFCLTCAGAFQDYGMKEEGRVLVDEIHSVWEFSTLKLDKNWYGDNSTYNAYSMVEWLNDTYNVDRIVSPSYKDWNLSEATKVKADIIAENISYNLLKNYDILVIKTPSRYESDEVDAIERFVKEGGGLFLIGDHTNFDGTSTNLNQIARRFGFEFNFDSVNTINGRLYHYERGPFPHPCIRYMPFLDFMTGCSLTSGPEAEPVILGFGLEAEPGEYASSGFFRETRRMDPTRTTDTAWGLINQAIAIKYGKGRVVAFPDSTIISNFRIFFGGSPNLVIGTMEYLNHENLFENDKLIFLLSGMLILAFAGYMLMRAGSWEKKKIATLMIIISLAALSVSTGLALLSVKPETSIPSQFYDMNNTICFDGQHSSPIVNQDNKSGEYETFVIWTQRVGLVPSIENDLADAMEKGRILVIVDPVTDLMDEDIASIQDYIRRGNFVLLMVNAKGQAEDLIKSFGMETYKIGEPKGKNQTLKNRSLPIDPWGLAIKGGHPLLAVQGRVVLAEKSYGAGKFVLLADSKIFKDGFRGRPGYLGYPKTDPDEMKNLNYDLRGLYDLDYYILEDVLAKGNSTETKPFMVTVSS